MIEISRLPKEPIAALKEVTHFLLSSAPNGDTTYDKLKALNHDYYQDLTVAAVICQRLAKQLPEPAIGELLEKNMIFGSGMNVKQISFRLRSSLNAILAFEMDAHFVDGELVEAFDVAEVPVGEREQIRLTLNEVRNLAANAEFMSDSVRISFLHKVSLAESELFKEKVGFQAFLAAAYEGSRLLRRYGEDAKPLAEAVEQARTQTEVHVTGYKAIEAKEAPKQIEGPISDTE